MFEHGGGPPGAGRRARRYAVERDAVRVRRALGRARGAHALARARVATGTHAWLVQLTGAPRFPSSRTSGRRSCRRTAWSPGARALARRRAAVTTHAELPHATAVPQLPVLSQVCTPWPEHWVEPGTHCPTQAPPTHAEFAQGAGAPNVPLLSQVSMPLFEQVVAVGVHGPRTPRSRTPGSSTRRRRPIGRSSRRSGRRSPSSSSSPGRTRRCRLRSRTRTGMRSWASMSPWPSRSARCWSSHRPRPSRSSSRSVRTRPGTTLPRPSHAGLIAAVDGASPLARRACLEPVARALGGSRNADARALRAGASAAGARLIGAPVAGRIAGLEAGPIALRRTRRAHALTRRRPGRDDARLIRADDGGPPVAARVARLNAVARALRAVRRADAAASARHARLVAAVHRRAPLAPRARLDAVAYALGRPRRADRARFRRGVHSRVSGRGFGQRADGRVARRRIDRRILARRIDGRVLARAHGVGHLGIGHGRFRGFGLRHARVSRLRLRIRGCVGTSAAAAGAPPTAAAAAAAPGRGARLSSGIQVDRVDLDARAAATGSHETPPEHTREGQPKPGSRIDHETSRGHLAHPGKGESRGAFESHSTAANSTPAGERYPIASAAKSRAPRSPRAGRRPS